MYASGAGPSKTFTQLNGEELILPAGYVFSPNEHELVVDYLKNRILNRQLPADLIPEIDIYSYSAPDQIPLGEFKYGVNNEWYFFATKPDSYPRSSNGCWRQILQREVLRRDEVVGFMQTLSFDFAKLLPDMKTEWYIDEYRVNPAIFAADELDDTIQDKVSKFVACKVCREEKETTDTSMDRRLEEREEISTSSDEE